MTIDQHAGNPSGSATHFRPALIPTDPDGTIHLTTPDASLCRAALAGLANARGGRIVMTAGLSEVDVAELAGQIDPPLTRLISVCAGADTSALIVNVRQSPQCPHIDAESGAIFEHDPAVGIVPVTTQAGLDRLYRKGHAAEERALRSIDGMIERMQLASFGHYGLAIVACLRIPSSEPYLWAAEHPDDLATSADPFIADWAFSSSMVRLRPGDAELRGDRDVTGVLRITRAGCVAVGETRRKPAADVLGSPEQIRERMHILAGTLCRALAHADNRIIMPRLLCEGLRGTKLDAGTTNAAQPAAATVDVVAEPGPVGDAGDPSYRLQLADQLLERLLAVYGRIPEISEPA